MTLTKLNHIQKSKIKLREKKGDWNTDYTDDTDFHRLNLYSLSFRFRCFLSGENRACELTEGKSLE